MTYPSGGCIKKNIVRKWVDKESFLTIFLSITDRSFRAPFFMSKGKAMDFFRKYKSPLGYYNNANQIDSYGVNHSGFTTRDELEYQFARQQRENELMNQYKVQDITENFPQYGANFWGNSANNYGFGTENIAGNIRGMNKTSVPVLPTSKSSNDANCYMTFDGQNLGLYNNNVKVDVLDAQSGQDNFQSAKYQNRANSGPLPEGIYYADQDQRQNINLKDTAIGTVIGIANKLGVNVDAGKWKGGPTAWGIRRVWLKPDENTITYGRSGFSIHGGLSKGSAGCIDIPWQTKQLSDYLDNCQDSVPVRVKYPKNW